MSTIDFNKPVTTDAYTSWPTTLQGNMQSLGFMLDPTFVTAYSNLVSGMKRINSSNGLIEQYNGTSWAALSTGYLLDSGDTMTGVLLMNNNVAHSWKDSGGTARRVLVVNGSNEIYVGDVDNALTAHSLHMVAQSSLSFEVNSTVVGSFSSTALGLSSGIVISSANSESLRTRNDVGFISFYNTAGSTRTGYVQGNTGSSLLMMAENGAALTLGTNGSVRATISTGGNIGQAVTPSAWGSSYRGFEMQAAGNGLMASSSTIYVVSNVYFDGTNWKYGQTAAASIYLQSAGAHGWYSLPSGTAGASGVPAQGMNLDINANLLVGFNNSSSSWNAAGRGAVEINGSSNAILGLKIGAAQAGYFYHSGTDILVNNILNGGVVLYANNTQRVAVNAGGNTNFTGSAATTPSNIGNTGGAVSLDCRASNVFTFTLTSNLTSLTLSNLSDGQTINVFITQDATGSRTLSGSLTAANGYLWPGGTQGVLSTAAGSVDLLCMTYRSATGKLYCTLTKAFS